MTQRVPVRLVQENGDRIDLDVHTMDLHIHRVFSAFPVPFSGGYNAGVDLNQTQVEVELQGVFADDSGIVVGAKATASIQCGFDTPPFAPPEQESGQPGALTFPASNSNSSSNSFRTVGAAFNPHRPGPIGTNPAVPQDEIGRVNFLNQLHNKYFDLPVAYQMSTDPQIASPAGNSVRFILDSKRSGSVREPYAYPRMVTRNTDLTAASSSSISDLGDGRMTITIASGDPRTWFETPDDVGTNAWTIAAGSANLGRVIAATSNTIFFYPFTGVSTSTSSQTNSQTVKIINARGIGIYNRSSDRPTVMIPIKHMFAASPPNFADGSSRTTGGAEVPGEALAYIISQAIASTTHSAVNGITDRNMNAAGGKDLSDAFSTTLTTGRNYKTKIIIEQKFEYDLENNGGIPTNIPHTIRPLIYGFSGGVTANRVKSAGDKVQDLLGIVTNSQNYNTNNPPTALGNLLEGLSLLTLFDRPEDIENVGDYIVGIQLPYDTTATRGKSELDTEIAQRNHFTTFGEQSQSNKLAIKNRTHASLPFNPTAQNSRRNGIRAMVTDFTAMHDAQERLYHFTMKLMAIDSLL